MRKSVLHVVAGGLVLVALLAATPARAEDKAAKPKEFTGMVVTADTKANMLTVRKITENMKATKEFKVGADTKFTGADKKAIALGDLKSGDKVTVAYTGSAKDLTATQVTVEMPKGEAPKK